ncbi:MAG: MBL fold metallo-hydrolase [Chlorobi bacterium]|nr:MBL fold metallo-hydrolase [Chlorobiota bacterium]
MLVETNETSIIIDTSSDFREQCLRFGIDRLDGVIYTHHHFDHIAGFDDLRAFNFVSKNSVPIYLMNETFAHLSRIFEYAFDPKKRKESSAPVVKPILIDDKSFSIGGVECTPIPLRHGSMRVNGYRIGGFAYCTDCNEITEEGYRRLEGIEYIILDGLRYRPHPTHMTIEKAIDTARKIGAKQTWLTHIAHDVQHRLVEKDLPHGINLAYDGLVINARSSRE